MNSQHENPRQFEIYSGSSVNEIRTKSQSHSCEYYGNLLHNLVYTELFDFESPIHTEYIGIGLVGSANDNGRVGCGELYLFNERIETAVSTTPTPIPSSSFTPIEPMTPVTVDNAAIRIISYGMDRRGTWELDTNNTLGHWTKEDGARRWC